MKIIVDHVPTTKKELAACFNILEQKYDEIMDEYGDRLIDAICQFLGEENLTEYVATTKKNAPIKPFYETKKLTKKLEHLAKTWAKEEQDIGNPVSGKPRIRIDMICMIDTQFFHSNLLLCVNKIGIFCLRV